MAILDSDIVAAIENAEDNFSLIPDGKYELTISGCKLNETNDRQGMYLQVEFTIYGPQYQGRKIWENFNLKNRSSKAENIGRANLKALSFAAGLNGTLRDTNDILNRHVIGYVWTEPANNPQYNDKNRVKNFKPVEGMVVTQAQAPAPVATAQVTAPAAPAAPTGANDNLSAPNGTGLPWGAD